MRRYRERNYEKVFQLQRRGLEKSSGSGIKVPEGIETGQQIRLEGFGNKGSGGGPSGDLYIVLRFVPQFPLSARATISSSRCRSPFLGGSRSQIESRRYMAKCFSRFPLGPNPTPNSGSAAKAPQCRTKVNGDQHVIVSIQTPTKLTSEQKSLFERVSESKTT